MHSNIFSEADLISFTAPEQMTYGERITILEEAKKNNGKWSALALVAPSGKKTKINLNSNKLEGRSLIVLRSWPDSGEKYRHEAILVEHLEQTVREIENTIIDLLRTDNKNDNKHKIVD
jgi:hypothetical protein